MVEIVLKDAELKVKYIKHPLLRTLTHSTEGNER